MSQLHYVYVLASEAHPHRRYTGLTGDLEKRLDSHNAGQVPHSARFRPWRLESAIVFRSLEKARVFAVFLKSSPGRAFARKHL